MNMISKRIFVSFAVEDKTLRDLLVGQARNENSPFNFTDMSVKQPWDSSWKTNCRIKIKGCAGMIIIMTNNSKNADGHIWEVKCAKEENIPCIGIFGSRDNKPNLLPNEFQGIRTVNWTWDNISNWINVL